MICKYLDLIMINMYLDYLNILNIHCFMFAPSCWKFYGSLILLYIFIIHTEFEN